ncbi:fimbrillin family protein [Sphingobacterium sp. BN32]|uniref:fimbrillin family protein n=1 Tax=Sphingobacterium sp. BN32 TaxID=3058432 RepID=UPI00265CF629|nr:fimbrillin family protein [Sphingobacterium sp. BN32]WKK57673.1 fimbrillin family protein [Sphingobacterium sp. BN32]
MNAIRRYLFAPFLISILVIVACEKPPHLKEEIRNGDYSLSFSVEGLDASEAVEPIVKPKHQSTGIKHIKGSSSDQCLGKKTIIASKTTAFKGLEARVIMEELPLEHSTVKSDKLRIQTKSAISRPVEKRAVSNMSPQKKYRVVVFNTNAAGEATTYVNQSQGVVGSPLKIPVYRNKNYRWFAYSYNREEDIPDINSTDYHILVIANLHDKENDFLYSTGLIKTSDIVDGENPISITFSRQLAKIRLEINARGIFAKITSANIDVLASNTGPQDGLFSLLNGSYSSTNNTNMLRFRTWNTIVSDSIPVDWAVYRDFYTIANSTVLRLKLKINEIKVTSERINDNAPDTKSLIPRTFQNVDFTFPDFIAKPGHRYQAVLELLESPIQRGDVYWARGNLYYDESVERNQYRFRYDNPHIRKVNNGISNIADSDYWYGGAMPHLRPDGQSDPCKFVYPEGLWRLPTPDEYNALISSTNPMVEKQDQLNREGWYIKWKDAAHIGPPTHPHKDLVFTALGYKNANGEILHYVYKAGNPNMGWLNHLFSSSDIGYFRTNVANTYFMMEYRTGGYDLSPKFTVGSTNVLYQPIAAPIRCVRKVAPNIS